MEKNIFSIYKVDLGKLNRIVESDGEGITIEAYLDTLMERLKSDVKEKSDGYIETIDYPGFKGLVYRTEVQPHWRKLIENMAGYTEIQGEIGKVSWLVNTNVSYVLFHECSSQIYAVTGGYGHHLLKDYIERNWGLYLITKFVRKDDAIIRELKENYLLGNTSTLSKANRNKTNFVTEREISAIYNEIFIELDDDGTAKLGIRADKNRKKMKTGVQLKDSVYIRKSLTISELGDVIKQINELESKDDNFSLSYFIPIRKCGITSVPLKNQLIQNLYNRKLDTIQLIGDDFINYCATSDEYYLWDDSEDIFYSSEDMLTIESIFEKFESENVKITKGFIEEFLMRWKICTKIKDGGYCVPPIRIYEAIQGFVEDKSSNMPYYIFQGQWYRMDKKYEQILDEEFKDLFRKWGGVADSIKEKFGLIKDEETEDKYNKSFYENPNMIVGHKALISNYEIADVFFWDDENLYIMCNKGKFDASGSRDLMNQIRASSTYLQTQMRAENRKEFISKLYNSIQRKYTKDGHTLSTSKEEFSELLTNRNYFYIAGFLSGYKENSNSPYAKCLTLDFYKEMMNKGFDCLVMGVGKE